MSVQPDGDRWRVRWRETVQTPDGSRRTVQRERVVSNEATASHLRSKILRALELGELPQLEPVRVLPVVCSLDQVFEGWMRAKAAKGSAPRSLELYADRAARVLSALRARHGIDTKAGVPASLLTRAEVVELTLALRTDGLADSTVYSTIGTLLSAWAWGCDDPVAYPGLPSAPRDPSSIMPRPPVYKAPPAPTMAELDAAIRHLPPRARRVAIPFALIARCTGLRAGQILALRVEDVDLAKGTLAVRTGKSALEKAGRVVPIAPALVEYLVPLVARRMAHERLIPHWKGSGPKAPSKMLTLAWQAATRAGLVREGVWKPANRELARPDHAFRAAFQAHLRAHRIDKETIDALVGHAGGLRERHYVDENSIWGAMKEAVALVPPVDWALPAEGAEVIPFPS